MAVTRQPHTDFPVDTVAEVQAACCSLERTQGRSCQLQRVDRSCLTALGGGVLEIEELPRTSCGKKCHRSLKDIFKQTNS